MKAISPTMAFVLLLLLGITAGGGFYLYLNRIQSKVMSKSSEIMVEAEIPPKLITLSCYDVYGCAYVNTAEKLVGKMRYTVMDDRGQEVLRSGLIDVNVSGAGKICFPMPLNASGWYWVKLGTEKWEIFERCKVREDPTLVLYLKFDEGSGTVAHDSSGYGNDGTLFDANTSNSDGNTPPQWVSGIYGYALEFDGVDDYVEVLNSTLFHGPDITVSFWIYQRTYGSPVSYITKRTTTSDGLMFFMWGGYTLYFDWGDGTDSHRWDTGYAPPLSRWVHLTITRNTNGRKLYVNGTPYANTTDAGGPIPGTNTAPLRLMADTYDFRYFVNGTIDEVRIYNRALSEAEIRAIYQAYAGG